MPDYIQDPNNSKKQIPGPKPANAYDRVGTITRCTLTKQPNSVLVTGTLDHSVGFFFGSSASFSAKATTEGGGALEATLASGSLTGSEHYINMFSGSSPGTKLDIHPLAASGSINDIQKIIFIYKGGLDGSGRP